MFVAAAATESAQSPFCPFSPFAPDPPIPLPSLVISLLSTDNFCAGYANTTSAVTGVRFHALSSNTISGTFKLYGVKDS